VSTGRVLLTGGSGFIGRHTAPALASLGFEVHAVGRRPGLAAHPHIRHHQADLLQPAEMRAAVEAIRPTHLLHLAWEVAPGRFWTDRANLDWVGASLGLYRAFAAAGGTRALMVGTCAEYAWEAMPLDEATTQIHPATLYGEAKAALHALATRAAAADGISFAWARLFWLYGPGEPANRLVSDVVANLLRGEPARCGNGLAARDFLHAADAGMALARTLASAHAGPVNVASGLPVKVGEILDTIASLTGRGDLIRRGARPSPPDEPPAIWGSTRVLEGVVGFTPRFTLQSGLADTIEWWRGALSGGR